MKEMLYEVRYLKSSEDMILALAGQFKQLSHEPEKFSHLNFSGSRDNCLNCPASARIISSLDFVTMSPFLLCLSDLRPLAHVLQPCRFSDGTENTVSFLVTK